MATYDPRDVYGPRLCLSPQDVPVPCTDPACPVHGPHRPLGWSGAMNKWRDPTRVAHLQVLKDGFVVNACGAASMTYGLTADTPQEAGGHACRRCAAIAKKKEQPCRS